MAFILYNTKPEKNAINSGSTQGKVQATVIYQALNFVATTFQENVYFMRDTPLHHHQRRKLMCNIHQMPWDYAALQDEIKLFSLTFQNCTVGYEGHHSGGLLIIFDHVEFSNSHPKNGTWMWPLKSWTASDYGGDNTTAELHAHVWWEIAPPVFGI